MPLTRTPIEQRFWTKVQKTETCWLWTAATTGGYGVIGAGGAGNGYVLAHRYSYETLVGPIPDGLQIDHLCRVRHCVRPDHLEAVERRTNLLRGVSPPAVQSRQTHCKNGHPFESGNTYVDPRGKRRCRTCYQVWTRARLHPQAPRTQCPRGHPYDAANTYVTRKGSPTCRRCRR